MLHKIREVRSDGKESLTVSEYGKVPGKEGCDMKEPNGEADAP